MVTYLLGRNTSIECFYSMYFHCEILCSVRPLKFDLGLDSQGSGLGLKCLASFNTSDVYRDWTLWVCLSVDWKWVEEFFFTNTRLLRHVMTPSYILMCCITFAICNSC